MGHLIMELDLQRRSTEDNRIITRKEKIAVDKLGVVLVDTWNYHWCMTATERCVSFTHRMNRALDGLRKLGIQVFWGPTDVADQYVGTPQRERAVAVEYRPLPEPLDLSFPTLSCYQAGGCMCGPGINCLVNYGWDAMNPKLDIGQDDLIVEGTQELYSWCVELGITHLIYLGFHTNVCTTGKPVGVGPMMCTGIKAILARDMTDAISGYDPATGQTPDRGTTEVIAQLEQVVSTINLMDELRKIELWQEDWIVDPVRITPWGKSERPYQFEESVSTTLSTPLNGECEIRYTLDGSKPTESSVLYTQPFAINETSTVRAVAFRDGKKACLESESHFVRLPDKPRMPDVFISDLEPIRATVSAYNMYSSKKRPSLDSSYLNAPLKLRGVAYEKGIGIEAPSQLLYTVESDYDRFVGLAGIEETMLEDENGRNRAMYPAVIFAVYIDGDLMAESPAMRISQTPWRFDVEIPQGSRKISLVCVPASGDARENFANWVNAGFIRAAS
jgi:hypothetical protein